MTTTLGFIGLGIMGSRMAANLQKAGYVLVVHNRTKSKADSLVENGAVWADSPAQVAQQADVLFTVLATPEAVAACALGSNGFLEHLGPDAIWIDCSTVNPSFSKEMAVEAASRNIRFLDAPVAGTKEPAEKGELLFVVGGEKDDVDACRPYFEIMGRGVNHVGPRGMGTSLKVVLNMMLAEAMLSFAQAVALGESLGISRDILLETVPASPIAAPFLISKAAKIKANDFETEFPLQWMHKDLQMVTTTAYEQGVALPMVNTAKEIYALAKNKGLADLDFSAIYKFLSQENDQ